MWALMTGERVIHEEQLSLPLFDAPEAPITFDAPKVPIYYRIEDENPNYDKNAFRRPRKAPKINPSSQASSKNTSPQQPK